MKLLKVVPGTTEQQSMETMVSTSSVPLRAQKDGISGAFSAGAANTAVNTAARRKYWKNIFVDFVALAVV